MEKAREFQKKTYTSALLNMPKPLTVWITTNWKIQKGMGIPDHLTYLLRNLHAGQESTVITGHRTTHWFQIGKGVCQGCIFSSCLFNLYAEYIVRGYSTLRDPICFLLLCAFSQGLSVPYQFLQNSNAELH